jgi:hypothetical protein
VTLRPLRENTSLKRLAAREQLVPVRQTGDAGEICTVPKTPLPPVPLEDCEPQAAAAATAIRPTTIPRSTSPLG